MKASKEHKPQQSRIIQCGKGGKKGTDFSKFLSKHGEHNVFVYGTETARNAMRTEKQLPQGFINVVKDNPVGYATKGFYTVDIYNNYSWRDFQYAGEANFSIYNPKYVPNSPEEIKNDLQNWTAKQKFKSETDKENVLAYQKQLLEHPSYSPIVTFYESEDFICAKTGYDDSNINKARFELQTRRACKFGLEYMSKGENKFVAFLPSIDGTMISGDDKFVTTKTKSSGRAGGRSGIPRIPITTSELLKAYRLELKNIVFFHPNGTILKDIWETDIESWNDYKTKRRNKYIAMCRNLQLESNPEQLSTEYLKERVITELKQRNNGDGSNSELLYLYKEGLLF